MTDKQAARAGSLLADPSSYRCALVEAAAADDGLIDGYLDFFDRQISRLVATALEERIAAGVPAVQARVQAGRLAADLGAYLTSLRAPRRQLLDLFAICAGRERLLAAHGFDDPFRLVKTHETEAALVRLPALLAELDALTEVDRARTLVEGVFAGNIFDLGASQTADLYTGGRLGFDAARESLRPRPWLVDDLDVWLERIARPEPYRCALLFVDNAGSDIVLGMLPFARDLVRRGLKVILSANTSPALNDVTHRELLAIVERASALDPVIRAARNGDRLVVVENGSGSPVLDLAHLSPALEEMIEHAGVDLVVLEGMGRALDSNYDARLRTDTLKIAMVKDDVVAHRYGGAMFDLVFRLESMRPSP